MTEEKKHKDRLRKAMKKTSQVVGGTLPRPKLTGLFMMNKKLIGSTRGESRNLKQRKKRSL